MKRETKESIYVALICIAVTSLVLYSVLRAIEQGGQRIIHRYERTK